MGVQLTGYKIGGEIECQSCHAHIDVNGNPIESKPKDKRRAPLTSVDILFRFILWSLGLSAFIAIVAEMVK